MAKYTKPNYSEQWASAGNPPKKHK